MAKQSKNALEQTVNDDSYVDPDLELGFVDAIRFLYRRRLKLTLYFLVFLVVGALAVLFWVLSLPRSVEAILDLNFPGIEKGEYPSGKKFDVEDFRSQNVLIKAQADAGISTERVQYQELAAHISITPVIPAEVRNRLLRQERDGIKIDEYYPNQFKIGITFGGLTDPQRLRLCDALIARYREQVKFDQKSALTFVSPWDASYEELAKSYDFWDIPELFRERYGALGRQLTSRITEAASYREARFQLSFSQIDRDLDTWARTRLQALEALTYQGQLVKNREIVMQRVRYRIQDLEIQIKQQTKEADSAIRLLEVIDRPKALLTGQLNNKDGVSAIDANVLDKLLKSDYVGPVVQRVSSLQQAIQIMESEKARLELQLTWLPKSSNTGQLSTGQRELVDILSSELNSIIQNYNRILDEYLTTTIANLITASQPPLPVSDRYSSGRILAVVLSLSVLLAVIAVGVERLFERVRKVPQNHEPLPAEGAENTADTTLR